MPPHADRPPPHLPSLPADGAGAERAPEFTMRRLGVLVWRALRLRCPNCGGRPVRASWMKRLPGCPTCGLRLDRGEHDYFIGAYLLNLIVAEVLLGTGLLAVLVATWPEPPWTAIQYGGVALMLVAPLATYPFAELLWLAFDLAFRPLTAAELQWHREGSVDDRELRHR